ncbi:MAG: ribonuclease E/G [Clostridia bacterium]
MNQKRIIYIRGNNDSVGIAVVEDGIFSEYLVEERGGIPEGSVIIGKVREYAPSLNAYFVDAGEDANAYLPEKYAGKTTLKPGAVLPFIVLRTARGSKGMTLGREIMLAGEFCAVDESGGPPRVSKKIKDPAERERLANIAVECKPEWGGVIFRTKAQGQTAEILEKDISDAFARLARIGKTSGSPGTVLFRPEGIIAGIMRTFNPATDTAYFNDIDIFGKHFDMYGRSGGPSVIKYYNEKYDMFDFFSISNKIKEAAGRKVRLGCGGTIVFDYTEAMCVIDVNSAKNTNSGNFRETAVKTNMEAAGEIAVQLRLRNIGGIVVVDFIETNEEDMKLVDSEFKGHLARDGRIVNAGGFTPLGMYELIRSRKGSVLGIENE